MESIFLSLLRSGLWSTPEDFSSVNSINWPSLVKIAKDQGLAGIIGDGINNSSESLSSIGLLPTKPLIRPLIIRVASTDQRNRQMNSFLSEFIPEIDSPDTPVLLVKGQGLGQFYPNPMSRTTGDIDFLVRERDYTTIRDILAKKVDKVHSEKKYSRHWAADLGGFEIELHGTLMSDFKTSVDKEIFNMQEEMFKKKNFTFWNGINLPSDEFNVVYIFVHILQHFYIWGIGFRQICDWCRFLYVTKDSIDRDKLLFHLNKMGILREWKVFGEMAVSYLGLPSDALPFYEKGFSKDARKLLSFIFFSGNFGCKYRKPYPKNYLAKKWQSLRLSTSLAMMKFRIFPKNMTISYLHYLSYSIKKLIREKGKDEE